MQRQRDYMNKTDLPLFFDLYGITSPRLSLGLFINLYSRFGTHMISFGKRTIYPFGEQNICDLCNLRLAAEILRY